MEAFCWDGSPDIICSSWDMQQQELEESLMQQLHNPIPKSYYINSRLDSLGGMQKNYSTSSLVGANPASVISSNMVHQSSSYPAALLDSMPDFPRWGSSLQGQELIKGAATDCVSAKSSGGACTGWSDDNALISDGLCSYSSVLNRASSYVMNPQNRNNRSVNDFGIASEAISAATTGGASLESLDCLLSAANSNTDNVSAEDDDGISKIFSDCKKSFKNLPPGAALFDGASSGESACAVSPSIMKADQERKPSSVTRKGATKRKNDPILMKAGENFQHFDFAKSDSSIATEGGGFQIIAETNNQPKAKKARSDNNYHQKRPPSSSNINFQQPSSSSVSSAEEPDSEAIAQMKEMIYRAAAFRPVNLGLEVVEKPKRKNVKISSDPQTVAARQRRERISERIRVLQKLVPGGSKMDTASMLDEAANYLKFLRSQVKQLEALGSNKISIDSSSAAPLLNNHSLIPMQSPHHHRFPLQKP